jgi:hypothetical protein
MKTPKFILFNSPKGSGKSHIGELLKGKLQDEVSHWWRVAQVDFKDILYEKTASLFGWDEDCFHEEATDRSSKDVVSDQLTITTSAYNTMCSYIDCSCSLSEERYAGKGMVKLTPREAMIYTAEIVLKPAFGQEYFGRQLVKHVKDYGNLEYVIECGTGFVEEVQPILEEYGKDVITVIQLHRQGFTEWGNDSRDYISIEGVEIVTAINLEGQEEDLVKQLVDGIIGEDSESK